MSCCSLLSCEHLALLSSSTTPGSPILVLLALSGFISTQSLSFLTPPSQWIFAFLFSPGVLFSWISVWLPEEFVEGRVFVALTVFLTLSAESSSAKETLPKVSYVKAIDVWFGFTAVFVFVRKFQILKMFSPTYQFSSPCCKHCLSSDSST